MRIKIVGILNVTTNSFSDGGLFLSTKDALAQVERLLLGGATVIDIEAQASGPGSSPLSATEEIERLRPLVKKMCKLVPVSVDTYRSEVARYALGEGASFVNDITAGSDPAMFPVVSEYRAKIVLMYSSQIAVHDFSRERERLDPVNPISKIAEYLKNRISCALQAGISADNIMIDPGMGAFVGKDPEVSWGILRNFTELQSLGHAIMLAVSRKGFLKTTDEQQLCDRDPASALISSTISGKLSFGNDLYLRVHNASIHKQFLELSERLRF